MVDGQLGLNGLGVHRHAVLGLKLDKEIVETLSQPMVVVFA